MLRGSSSSRMTQTSALERRHLRALGHQVDIADSGDDGLAAAAHQTPDVVFVDFGLPGMDGVQVIDAPRAQAATDKCYVILASAVERDDLQVRVDAVLEKPFSRQDVARVMATVGFGPGPDDGPQETS